MKCDEIKMKISVDDNTIPMNLESERVIVQNDHKFLINRDAQDQHPISSITGLNDEIVSIENDLLTKGQEIQSLETRVQNNETEINNLGGSVESLDSDVTILNTNKVDKRVGYDLSKNDFTDLAKVKLDTLENYDDTQVLEDIQAHSNSIMQLEIEKVDVEVGKGLSQENYTSLEKSKLAGLNNYNDTEVKQSIASIENALTSVYTKSETYNKTEVNNLISGISGLTFMKVDELPAIGENGIIYLVPKTSPSGQDYFDEYLWFENKYEFIGTTQIDLTNYYTKNEIDNELLNKVDKVLGKSLINDSEITRLANVTNYNDAEVRSLITSLDSSKQDNLSVSQLTNINEVPNKANKIDVYTKIEVDTAIQQAILDSWDGEY